MRSPTADVAQRNPLGYFTCTKMIYEFSVNAERSMAENLNIIAEMTGGARGARAMFGKANFGTANYQAFAGFSSSGGGNLSEQEINSGAIEMGSKPNMVHAMLSAVSANIGEDMGGYTSCGNKDIDVLCGYSATMRALAQAAGKARVISGSVDRKCVGCDGDENFGSQAHTHILCDCMQKHTPRV